MKTITENWNIITYAEAWEKQTEYFNEIIDAKVNNKPHTNTLIFCEHPHVYTIGKHGKDANLLINDQFLKQIQASYFHIDRGGDITYHGPGQIVCYPIIDLEDYHLGLKEYIHLLEEAVIQTCRHYGVEAGRLEKATGVWLDAHQPTARKICAIGVRCSRYVSMHGLAFNVNTNLNYFNYINPCGFVDKGVTSLSKELGKEIPFKEAEKVLEEHLLKLLNDQVSVK